MSEYPTPRNTFVLVRKLRTPDASVGGIHLPEQLREKFMYAEVLAVGPGATHGDSILSETADLHPGQKVMVQAWQAHPQRGKLLQGLEVMHDGTTLYMFQEPLIVMIVAEPGEWDPVEDRDDRSVAQPPSLVLTD